jgi:ArsR family transcriptional regulator
MSTVPSSPSSRRYIPAPHENVSTLRVADWLARGLAGGGDFIVFTGSDTLNGGSPQMRESAYMRLRIYMEARILAPMNMSDDPALLFRALSDTTRLRCLVLLQREEELCVCELTYATGVVQPKISRHLAQLREAGLVRDRRAGQWVYYRLNPDLPAWVAGVLRGTAEGLGSQPPFVTDSEALRNMPNRPGASCCA